jgi:hypothetical protein
VVGIILGLAVVLVPIAFADKPSPGIFPPDSKPFGKKYKEWSAEWWQFVLSIPSSENPTLDETGEKCVVGQHGPVWFLGGEFNETGISVRNNCSIPEGKALFFAVLNVLSFNSPNVCGQGPENASVDELRAGAADIVDDAISLAGAVSVEVDGKPVQKLQERFRIKSIVFEIVLPEDNVLDAPCTGAGLGNVPVGIYSPSVDDGFYVMLKPLDVGKHTLHMRGQFPDFTFDVTYNLTVVPVLIK